MKIERMFRTLGGTTYIQTINAFDDRVIENWHSEPPRKIKGAMYATKAECERLQELHEQGEDPATLLSESRELYEGDDGRILFLLRDGTFRRSSPVIDIDPAFTESDNPLDRLVHDDDLEGMP
jgi:hypothetical protein